MTGAALGAVVGGGACALAAPYLASLARTVPDREATRWWRPVAVERGELARAAGVGLVLGLLAGAAAGLGAALPAFLALALLGTPLVLIDLAHHRLPDRLVFPLAGLAAVLLSVAAAATGRWDDLLRAAQAAVAVFAAFALLRLISPRSFGYGDVKIGGVLGAYLGWTGWGAVYYGVFAGFLLGALVAVGLLAARRATRKTAIAFGPSLVLGTLVVLAFDLVPTALR